MSSLDKTDRIIINLKVVSTLTEGQRLCVRNKMFSVYDDGWTQALYRWLFSENRWANIDDIQSEFNDALRILGTYITLIQTGFSTVADHAIPVPTPDTCASFVTSLARELQQAVVGLQNLQHTYAADQRLVATLALLIERTNGEIEKARRITASQLAPNSPGSGQASAQDESSAKKQAPKPQKILDRQ